MVSPVYFILADGKSQNDGCVITREREKVHATVNLNQEKDQTKSGSWFLLQTNYDPDKSPPFFDDRRNPGIKVCSRAFIGSIPVCFSRLLGLYRSVLVVQVATSGRVSSLFTLKFSV